MAGVTLLIHKFIDEKSDRQSGQGWPCAQLTRPPRTTRTSHDMEKTKGNVSFPLFIEVNDGEHRLFFFPSLCSTFMQLHVVVPGKNRRQPQTSTEQLGRGDCG